MTLSDLGRHEEAINHVQAALVLLQDELFNVDPPAPNKDVRAGPLVGCAKGSDHFKARATVLAVCYYNHGVEEEFLGRPGCAQSFKLAADIAGAHLGPDHYITKQVNQAHTAAVNRAQAALGRPATRSSVFGPKLELEPLDPSDPMLAEGDDEIHSPKTDGGDGEDPWAVLEDSGTEPSEAEGPNPFGGGGLGAGGFMEGLPGAGRETMEKLCAVLDQENEDEIDVHNLRDLFEQGRMWGPIEGNVPLERALEKLSQWHEEELDKLLCSADPKPREQIRAAYNQACKYVPSEKMAMERAHAVIFDRIVEEMEGALGDGAPAVQKGSRAPDKKLLCSHVFDDAKKYLGENHPLVIEAKVIMLVQFKVDVKTTHMCYHCNRHTYPCTEKSEIQRSDGTFGDLECSRCSKAYVEDCENCSKRAVPTFVSAETSGVPGGQLFCPECKSDHGVRMVWRRFCYSCKNHVYCKNRGSSTTKFNCHLCGAKMTQYCSDCKKDTIIIRWADNEPRCYGCKETFQAIEVRHTAQVLDKERAQEKLTHVVKWIRAMWTGDFLQQVYHVWAKGSIDRLHKRKLMKKMIARVSKRQLSEGFQGWLEVVMSLQRRRVDAIVKCDLMLSSSTQDKYIYFYEVWKEAWIDFKNLTAGQKEARRLFDVFDADGSGVITLEELRFRMSDWGYDDDTIERTMLKVDLDNDGNVTWSEFLQGFEVIRKILGLAVQDGE